MILLTCMTLIVTGCVAVFMLRRQNLTSPTPQSFTHAAQQMNLQVKSNRLVGAYRNYPINVETLLPRADRAGVQITLRTEHPVGGELRFSGPSENAGTGTPEVKILTGNGAFDYHFWIIKSQPRSLAQDLFGEPDDTTQHLVDAAPFGQWHFVGSSLSYAGYDSGTSHIATNAQTIQQVADLLVDLAQKIDRRNG